MHQIMQSSLSADRSALAIGHTSSCRGGLRPTKPGNDMIATKHRYRAITNPVTRQQTICRAAEQLQRSDSYRTIVQGRNVKLTEALKAFSEEKLAKALDKYGTHIKEVDINLSVSGGHRGKGDEKQKCEITIFMYRLGLVRAEEVEENMYAAIEKVTDIVSRKMRKVKEKAIAKGKWEGSAGPRGHSAYKELPEEVSLSDTDEEIDLDAPAPSFPSEIIRTKVLGLTPTTMETALEQVEQLGHAFYIFRDKDDKLKVLYKRKVSGYGVIVPQFL